jgi:hypothetical protein
MTTTSWAADHKGGVAAVGFLCAIAATVALWSGPLAAASSALHSGASSVPVHQAVGARAAR